MKVLLSCLLSNLVFAVLGYLSGKATTIIKVKDKEEVKIINPLELSSRETNLESEEEAIVPDERQYKSFF